jgi:hypothetical protein
MERGVVVGGLMICGSFLLAAALNRSAVKETPPAAPAIAEAPITPPLLAVPADQPTSATCASDANSSGNEPVAANEPDQGDLPGNGRKACSQ